MIFRISDNIVSPLGFDTNANYAAVRDGLTSLRSYDTGKWNMPFAFTASLFSQQQEDSIMKQGLTRFESMVVASAQRALTDAGIDVASPRVLFVLSTTKGNIEMLRHDAAVPEEEYPGVAARRIARYLGITTCPLVVCNACISGAAALLIAMRMLDDGCYDYAVVCGADSQGQFIVSGFQSLQALSPAECRPFDMERLGLNLGEAAATMVLRSAETNPERNATDWALEQGAVRNDAFHISTPSKTGEGAYRALQSAMQDADVDDVAFINAHGTATMFNDQMESVAIVRAGLDSVPVNAYKGYYGHTMGAAGLLETILSIAACDNNTILATRGYEEMGVSGQINVSNINSTTDKSRFVKMISGFGGCNASLLWGRGGDAKQQENIRTMQTTHHVTITPSEVTLDGVQLSVEEHGAEMLTSLYKSHVNDYAKYYKMDMLCRLGFIATELLLNAEGAPRFVDNGDRAVILFNRSSSVDADRRYQESIADPANYYPSPSIFVYTLPNIVTGEIAMRNHYHGETSFYLLAERDDQMIANVLHASLLDRDSKSILTGWIDYYDADNFCADISIVEIK